MNVIEDQWQYLAQIKRLSRPELNKLLSQISPNGNLISEQEVTDTRPPWEITAKPRPLVLENPPQQVTITLANHIYFEVKAMPSALSARLRRLASFSNPVFFKTQALRFSTHGIPRFISCARIERGYLALPRGCLEGALALLKENNIDVQIDDTRELGIKLSDIKPLLTLRKNQQIAVKEMCKHDAGILHAPTAFGKTVTAIGMIAKSKTNTLILLHNHQPHDQWQERLRSFFAGGGNRRHPRR